MPGGQSQSITQTGSTATAEAAAAPTNIATPPPAAAPGRRPTAQNTQIGTHQGGEPQLDPAVHIEAGLRALLVQGLTTFGGKGRALAAV